MKEILDFLKQLSDTITWPVGILIIAFLFRKQLLLIIKALTHRIETADKISITNDGVVIQQKLAAVEKKADDALKDMLSLFITGLQRLKDITPSTTQPAINMLSANEDASVITVDNNDSQKGKWGKQSRSNNRLLSAKVTPLPDGRLYRIELEVIATNPMKPLKDKVTFHLPPTFPNPEQKVEVVDGKASLRLIAYGSFTVGAEADNGGTKLELDLAEVEGVTE
jgi:hypothetical protein